MSVGLDEKLLDLNLFYIWSYLCSLTIPIHITVTLHKQPAIHLNNLQGFILLLLTKFYEHHIIAILTQLLVDKVENNAALNC